MRPVIGMIDWVADQQLSSAFYHQVPRFYTEVLDKNGACVIHLPALKDSENIEKYVSMIDGLLIPGGDDIAPVRYGEEPFVALENVSAVRDEFELKIIAEAIKQKKPILGVCRGMQILNVALGGTLYQDIPRQYENAIQHLQRGPFHEEWHKVQFEKGSILHGIYGDSLMTNTGHHQALKDVSDKLKVIGRASDGMVEAVESNMDGQFILAIQWHPEMMYEKHPEQAKFFEYFVEYLKK